MIKIEVPYISQKDKYPTGCESVSTTMLLQYLGYEISVEEFIAGYLKMKPFEEIDGEVFGADPREYFCGSPYDEKAFGCYSPVICNALNDIFQEDGACYEAMDESGTEMQELLNRYIDNGMPVIFWACINMKEPIIGPEWKLYDSGEVFTWISNEHCLLLVGYDEEGYCFNDPYDGHGVVRYPKDLVLARHKAQYEMAVGVRKLK